MKSIPSEAKNIKISFVCDVCSIDMTHEANLSENLIEIECPVCYKTFSFNVIESGAYLETSDIADESFTIEVI